MAEANKVAYWLVGASQDGATHDLTQEFLEEGVWKSFFTDRYLDTVRSMKPGDKIAIKSTFTKKSGLPFENKGQVVSVMDIKAIGTIVENPADGKNVKVLWDKSFNKKQWYFYTYRKTIWKLNPDKEYARDLIQFVFNGQAQDIPKYINDPYWAKRYGNEFAWTPFYIEFADALLKYKENRTELIEIIERTSKKVEVMKLHKDTYTNGKIGPLRDICPFTFLGLFNKGLTAKNRNLIAESFRLEMGVSLPAPHDFPGIPTLMNQAAWFFRYEQNRGPHDIDKLWDLFEKAINFADSDAFDQKPLIAAFDEALNVPGSKWNLTMGLYWVRPWNFATLDSNSRKLIKEKLHIEIPTSETNKMISGTDYLELIDNLAEKFEEETFPVHSYPELSLIAWKGGQIPNVEDAETNHAERTITIEGTYGIDDILAEGGFVSEAFLEDTLETLRTKKNIILQGPPGTGKSWLAKRIAYALRGNKIDGGVTAMQFHANMSYEDFIRGWRPIEKGALNLNDGPFLELVQKAIENPDENFVFVIEEINRGNPAQIFGEMLTLLENDKRIPEESLQITYRRNHEERIYIPKNFYVIGTMNTADKSLAILDFAFRRRFAFKTLEPLFNANWQNWLSERFDIDLPKSRKLQLAVGNLNQIIREDQNLGHSYEIGHSYFTPSSIEECENYQEWIERVLTSQILPTLNEYWYDERSRARESVERFLIETR